MVFEAVTAVYFQNTRREEDRIGSHFTCNEGIQTLCPYRWDGKAEEEDILKAGRVMFYEIGVDFFQKKVARSW